MTESRVRSILYNCDAISEGHYVGTNGDHISEYYNKARITQHPKLVLEFCSEIVGRFLAERIEVVAAPAVGAIVLGYEVAKQLSIIHGVDVLSVFTEPYDEALELLSYKKSCHGSIEEFDVEKGENFFQRYPFMALRRDFDKAVSGKRALLIDDTTTTGGSILKTGEAVKNAGGIIVGAAVIINGGGVTAKMCGVPRFESVIALPRMVYSPEECKQSGMCAAGIPINTDLGHG
jgi:orotate phosphoribosyltransferase